jgi:ATP-dependent RNA helicase RhlE
LIDLQNRGKAGLKGVRTLILDEADRMLDMGFWPDVRRIVAALPASRQTLLFSATTSGDVMRAAALIMRDPKVIRVGRTSGLATAITHVGHVLPAHEKTPWLAEFLRRTNGPTLVFVRTKRWAERLAKRLASGNICCAALHANRTQSQRTAAMEGFRSGRYRVLVATDIAARGLDIECIGHIINYEVPATPDAYVHRVGRTGRAAATGTAVTLVAPEEIPALRVIERSLNLRLTHPGGPGRRPDASPMSPPSMYRPLKQRHRVPGRT